MEEMYWFFFENCVLDMLVLLMDFLGEHLLHQFHA